MNKKEYFNYVLKLIDTEKRISVLEQEIQDYIKDNEYMSIEHLLNIGHKYSQLYTLKKNKDNLFNKVAIGYQYIQD